MKIFSKSLFFPILTITFSVVIYILFINTKPEVNPKNELIKFPVVEGFPLKAENFTSTINTYGEIISTKVLEIQYPDNGKIHLVGNLSNGSNLQKGDLIFSIDSFELENNIKRYEAEKKIIEFNIEKISKQIFSKSLYKQEVQNQKNILSKQLKDKLSIQGNSISKNMLDELRLSLSRLDETLIKTEELINVLNIDFKSNETELKKVNIILEQFDRDLKDTLVTAPFSGYIENFKIYEGQEIFKNEILGKLTDTKNLEVKFFIGGQDYNNLLKFKDKGLGSLVKIKWLVGKKVYLSKAVITGLDGELNNQTAGIYLYAKLIENTHNIPIGAFVEVNMERQIINKSIKIPYSAVFNNEYIFILEGNYLRKIYLNIISEEKNGVLVDNLDLEGKLIVTSRLSDMKDNMQVQLFSNYKK